MDQEALQDLIVDDREGGVFRVHRSTMTSQELFLKERQAILDTCWIYLGHDSEVEKPGDFVRRTIFGKPLIFLRDVDGNVGAMYNTCTHRGAELCREDKGNTKHFQCFYHAWAFNTRGELVAVPDEAGYGPGFSREERALVRPPQVDSYRGFVFVSFNASVPSLSDYLGGLKEYIDLIVDQADEGMRIVEGSNLYATGSNWKLMMENSVGGYHAMPLHQTYFAYIKSLGGGLQGEWKSIPTRDLGNGHVAIETEAPYGRPIAKWDPLFGEDAKEEIEGIQQHLVEKYGPERANRMTHHIRQVVVFPNLIINDIMAITIRQFDPIAVDRMNTTAWALAPREESGARLARRIDSFLTFIGPGGFATPDDVEALESCQIGFGAQPDVEWSDMSRGMARVPDIMDELQMRTFWRAWHAMMLGTYPAPRVSVPEVPGSAAEPEAETVDARR